MKTPTIHETVKTITEAIRQRDYDKLQKAAYTIPEQFNWARDVFEDIYLKEQPERNLLELIRDGGGQTLITYKEAGDKMNQLLNYMRKYDVQKGDRVFVMCGLHEDLWVSYLSIIKGGYVMIPAAGILTAEDIAYRFEKAAPKAIITDKENLPKIESALKQYNKEIPVKLLLDELQEGWQNFSVVNAESTQALAADTKAGDVLFWFFTSGTTGFPKVVAHTQASYPLGHLSTAAWIGLKPGG